MNNNYGYWVSVCPRHSGSLELGQTLKDLPFEWVVDYPENYLLTGSGATKDASLEDFKKNLKYLKNCGSSLMPKPENKLDAEDWFESMLEFIPLDQIN